MPDPIIPDLVFEILGVVHEKAKTATEEAKRAAASAEEAEKEIAAAIEKLRAFGPTSE